MGMDAKVYIWVGIKIIDQDNIRNEQTGEFENIFEREIKPKLPSELFDEYGYLGLDEERLKYTLGVQFQEIECSGITCGYGIVVFYHDWDYGVVDFNIEKIQKKIYKGKSDMEYFLSRYKIDQEKIKIDVWCQTDFS